MIGPKTARKSAIVLAFLLLVAPAAENVLITQDATVYYVPVAPVPATPPAPAR